MPRLLEDLTVIDLTQGISGPYAGQCLADLGARVIKVEPLAGDYARSFEPRVARTESAVWLSLNREKASVAVDLEGDQGQEVVRRLVQRADVVLEDFGPGEAERLHLGYERLSESHSDLVYCALSWFGEEGPLKELPGSELVIQAMTEYWAGLGRVGGPPVRLGIDLASMQTGVYALQAVLAAVFHRGTTGAGQRVAVSALGVMLHERGIMWSSMGDPDEWYGHHCDSYTNPPAFGYQTKDSPIYFSLRSADEADWVSILNEFEMVEMAADERFAGAGREAVGSGRYANEVRPIWEEAFKDLTADEIMETLLRNHAEAVPINDYQSLLAHPQVHSLDLVAEVDDATLGPWRAVLPPWGKGTSGGPTEPRRIATAPRLGQDTGEILTWLGYSGSAIDALYADGIAANGEGMPGAKADQEER